MCYREVYIHIFHQPDGGTLGTKGTAARATAAGYHLWCKTSVTTTSVHRWPMLLALRRSSIHLHVRLSTSVHVIIVPDLGP